MIGMPKIETRPEQPYMGYRTHATMAQLSETIPQGLDEVFAWLGQQGIEPAGPPFIRYHIIDMAGQLDVELGVAVATTLPGNGRVAAGSLPAGRYAALVYTGVQNGIAGNAALLEWGAAQGLQWDQWSTPNGDAFGARVEFFLTEPNVEPDPAKWEHEVAIRLADG